MKLKVIFNDILKENISEKVLAYLYTIEFQKYGLSHIYVLFILAQPYNPKTVTDYNAIISAEISDKNINPNTYNTITRLIIYGLYDIFNLNASYIKDEKYFKRYPQNFQENTTENEDGYPIYRRRNNNQTVKVRGIQLDNHWIVPYNPYLITKYDCHINIEIYLLQ